MPELPEATVLARQADAALRGAKFAAVSVRQPKCLNMPSTALAAGLIGATWESSVSRGKWIVAKLSPPGRLCINLGMGGDLLLHASEAELPEKWAVRLDFTDGRTLTAGFWWFGYVHLLGPAAGPRGGHPVDELGPSPLDLDLGAFRALLRSSPAAAIKSVLMDQRRISGIGNVTVQDPLWVARIHPLRKVKSLTDEEIRDLHESLTGRLRAAIDCGGCRFEKDLYGQVGTWGGEHFLVAYRPGEPCPRCGRPIEKIKTGATSTHICPACQVSG